MIDYWRSREIIEIKRGYKTELIECYDNMDIEPIQNKIFVIRDYKVMLDFHLAEIYEVETRRLKEQVRRNMERFPNDFMFQLTKIEWNEVIANCDNF